MTKRVKYSLIFFASVSIIIPAVTVPIVLSQNKTEVIKAKDFLTLDSSRQTNFLSENTVQELRKNHLTQTDLEEYFHTQVSARNYQEFYNYSFLVKSLNDPMLLKSAQNLFLNTNYSFPDINIINQSFYLGIYKNLDLTLPTALREKVLKIYTSHYSTSESLFKWHNDVSSSDVSSNSLNADLSVSALILNTVPKNIDLKSKFDITKAIAKYQSNFSYSVQNDSNNTNYFDQSGGTYLYFLSSFNIEESAKVLNDPKISAFVHYWSEIANKLVLTDFKDFAKFEDIYTALYKFSNNLNTKNFLDFLHNPNFINSKIGFEDLGKVNRIVVEANLMNDNQEQNFKTFLLEYIAQAPSKMSSGKTIPDQELTAYSYFLGYNYSKTNKALENFIVNDINNFALNNEQNQRISTFKIVMNAYFELLTLKNLNKDLLKENSQKLIQNFQTLLSQSQPVLGLYYIIDALSYLSSLEEVKIPEKEFTIICNLITDNRDTITKNPTIESVAALYIDQILEFNIFDKNDYQKVLEKLVTPKGFKTSVTEATEDLQSTHFVMKITKSIYPDLFINYLSNAKDLVTSLQNNQQIANLDLSSWMKLQYHLKDLQSLLS